jgi:ribosomal 50S subunit-recycling heat shock protein
MAGKIKVNWQRTKPRLEVKSSADLDISNEKL